MKCKNFLKSFLVTALMSVFVLSGSTIYADNQVLTNPSLTVTPNNEGNYISLNWKAPDTSKNYSYMIYSKKSTDSDFQSIPAKGKVKVLNVYPDVGNNLKTWMETNGYGKGLISVDEVSIDNFNADPTNYLKDSNGNWKYDVIYEGAWDDNNGKDLSANAEQAVEEFIKAGRGYLGGHDTFLDYSANRNKLSSYLNIIPNVSSWYGNTSVKINKKGLLTNYPWQIGDVGTTLTVPLSHSTGQYAFGDIWIKYNGNSWNSDTETNIYNGKTTTNNFYLTTWNNTAMIQTGHSDGSATPDEQKIIANTLFYLAQVTDDTSWDDHKGQDLDAPTKPIVTNVLNDTSRNKINISFKPSTDNGTTYQYYVEAKDLASGVKTNSDTKTATITSGIKGYSIVVDKNPDTIPPNTITTTSTNYVVNEAYKQDFYVHVAAIDNAGNMSEVTHYKSRVNYARGITVDKTMDVLLVGDTDKLTALVTPRNAANKTIKWTSSDPSVATVDDNGQITALKEGTTTILATVDDGSNLHAPCIVTVIKPTE